ncbi:MAG: cytochrome c maturation protein CcmE [Pseudomonadota bacterium]
MAAPRTVGARKKRRIMLISLGAVALISTMTVIGFLFSDALAFFKPPSQIVAEAEDGSLRPDRRLRLGGMVVEGSLERGRGEAITFTVTDYEAEIPVTYSGLLPDLFAEGEGVVAEGYYRDGMFEAETILAKHDEEYMPREVVKAVDGKGPGS